MSIIEIFGYTFIVILGFILGWIIYHIIKAVVLGTDLYLWRIRSITWKTIKKIPNYRKLLIKEIINSWVECFFYNGDTTWTKNGKRWNGFGTGR